MADRPAPSRRTLRDALVVGVVLVVGAALLFGLIGAVTEDDDTDVVAEPTTSESPEPTDDPTETADPTASPEPTDAASPTESDDEVEPSPTETPSSPTDGIDPASVTIQVLDGVLDDDRTKHGQLVACLEAAGYDDLITSNRARRAYDTTTIFYTEGADNEAAARQVAAALGYGQVEVQPGNLSEAVPVHIVVGADARAC